MKKITKIEFDFNTDGKVSQVLITHADSTLKTAYMLRYTETGHFTFAPNSPMPLRSRLAMMVGALNSMEPRNGN